MDVLIGIVVSAILFLFAVITGIDIIYSLILVLLIFIFITLRRGFTLKETLKMIFNSSKKSLIVLEVFILIGALISAWMAAGTVPAIVYYGINLIDPNLFILSAFILSAVVSILIGTSFGTVGTIGISMMLMARAGGGNELMVGGAIIAGVYFGDRCSPMSSSANLVASITDTDLYTNIKNMLKTSILPLVLSIIFYLVLSLNYPLNYSESNVLNNIIKYFDTNLIVLLPAVVILILCVLKVKVKTSMFISILIASFIAVIYQSVSIKDIMKYLVMGFNLPQDNPLAGIIKGGGLISMVKSSAMVMISSGLAGLFEGAKMLDYIEELMKKADSRPKIFLYTIVSSICASAFGCTQALAIMMTHLLMKNCYRDRSVDNYSLAVDLENTAIVIAPLIPWNIAAMIPLENLELSSKSLVFAIYLYLIPLINLVTLYFKHKLELKSINELNV